MLDTTLLAHSMRAVLIRYPRALFPSTYNLFVLCRNNKASASLVALILMERTLRPVLQLITIV